MSIVTVTKNTYTVESLYQWDKDQVLEIRGLSLPAVPEIHFTNAAMGAAIVRQASMDAAGIITADVPNSLLQKPYKIKAYICQYSGSTFETLYKVEIPVVPRAMPADYTLEDDAEVYSFNALENKVENALVEVRAMNSQATASLTAATDAMNAAKDDYVAARDTIQVTGFNGRTGAIVPQTGDYTAEMVGALAASALGSANGVAGLDANGKLSAAYRPAPENTDAITLTHNTYSYTGTVKKVGSLTFAVFTDVVIRARRDPVFTINKSFTFGIALPFITGVASYSGRNNAGPVVFSGNSFTVPASFTADTSDSYTNEMGIVLILA